MSFEILDIKGYHLLSMHLAFSGIVIFTIVLITIFFAHGVHHIYLQLYQSPRLRTWIIRYIGYRSDQTFVEFLILKTVLQILVIATGVYLIGISMDFASFYIEKFFAKLTDGIHVADFIINPCRILSGLFIFSVLFLLFRAISTAIIRYHQSDKDEEETQVALASIATYAGFLIAVIAGLIIAGFNFTGLAIVAGALSVGIGLGLQSIVNNFVSGLILLIEKPIRPGDRINVDGAEGFVKKIRIRSTQIITPSREDIIIPNSDLITRRVTNYMFSDKFCLVTCEIGVAYGSDIQLVRDTLLTIANLHEDVVKTGRMKPTVLFQAFGDNNLIFQLLCLIKDVNKKMIVRSDLNFAIEAAFRHHQINMAFPQREIHVTWPTMDFPEK
jgi:potassium efflux system protein